MRLLAPVIFICVCLVCCAAWLRHASAPSPVPASPNPPRIAFSPRAGAPAPLSSPVSAPAPSALSARLPASPSVSVASPTSRHPAPLAGSASPASSPAPAHATPTGAPHSPFGLGSSLPRTAPLSFPAVLAPRLENTPLTPEQRAGAEELAELLLDEAGDPGQAGFAENILQAASDADLRYRQLYGHHAWVRLQLAAAQQLGSP